MLSRLPIPSLSLLTLTSLLLAGCGGTNQTSAPPPTPPPVTGFPGIAISGKAQAGANPIAGASVQLYAAGTTGNGSTATPLSSAATTSATGAFSIAAGYTCPAASSQLYLIARNGVVAANPNNSAIALAVPLGRCDAATASSTYILNEVTTAATAWALAQFLAPGTNLGATSTNAAGLANAVATALSLAGNTTGASPGPTYPANGSSPAPRINALANLLNACTANAGPGLFRCTSLLALSSPDPTPLTNTLDAALAIVRSPGHNVLPLYNLSHDGTAFSPTLSAAPADWTLPLTFTGAGMDAPGPLAIDSTGNVWVASYFGVVSEFSPVGAPTFPSGITGSGLSESYGLAIDPSGNIWITDENSPTVNNNFGAVTVLNPSGQPLSGPAGFSTGGLNYPIAVALDSNGTAWVVDYGNSHLTLFNRSGQPLSGPTGYFSSQFAFPVAIALDASHNAWVANMSGNTITRVSPDGQQFTSFNCCNGASGLALDQQGNVWVANYVGSSVSEVFPNGPAPFTGYIAPSIKNPQGIAIDGAGHVWIASYRGNSITELDTATSAAPAKLLSPTAGWAPTPTSLQAFAIAVDSSGNLWTSNFADNSITKIVGLATPVKTPLSLLPQLP